MKPIDNRKDVGIMTKETLLDFEYVGPTCASVRIRWYDTEDERYVYLSGLVQEENNE